MGQLRDRANAQPHLGKEAHLSAGMSRSEKMLKAGEGGMKKKNPKGENGCCRKGRNSRWQWQAWVLGRELRALLHVANMARVLCADARIAMLCACRRAPAGERGDGLAGAHRLEGCLGKESACAGLGCLSST